jgi:hypothetical protein
MDTDIDGVGMDSSSIQSLSHPIKSFLKWGESVNVKRRFDQFCNEFYEEFVELLDTCNEEKDGYSLKTYDIFQKYEQFFTIELQTFLEQENIEEEEFTNACSDINKEQCEGNSLLKLALSSLDYGTFREMMVQFNDDVQDAKEAASDMGL